LIQEDQMMNQLFVLVLLQLEQLALLQSLRQLLQPQELPQGQLLLGD